MEINYQLLEIVIIRFLRWKHIHVQRDKWSSTNRTNVGSILNDEGSETLHNIASCGKIELPCPPNANAQ